MICPPGIKRRNYRMIKLAELILFVLIFLCVVGTGSTYQEAYRDAVMKIPPGKHYYRVVTNYRFGIYYVTLYCR
jgi:hypothetical protein